MENPIKYILVPTLEDMALVQIAVAMWSHKNVVDSIAENLRNEKSRMGAIFAVQDRLIEKVEQLKQPETFQEKIKRSIEFICERIDDWVELHREYSVALLNESDIYLPLAFRFTPHGTIDEKKTAEMIVKEKDLDVRQRYEFACVHCLRDDVMELWDEMPKECQESLLNEYSLNGETENMEEELLNGCGYVREYSRNMVRLWTLAIKKEQLDYTISFPYLLDILKSSVRRLNKTAIEYFLQGLEPTSIESTFVHTAKHTTRTDFLCFLLSKMTAEQQLQVFKHNTGVIYSFLRWPYQSFFMDTADRMWDFFSQDDYKRLFNIIAFRYKEIFQEFWQKSPSQLKRSIINDIDILEHLIYKRDKKNLVLILQSVAHLEKKELTNCDTVRNLCKKYLSKCDWSSLEFFVRKCLFENSVRDEMLKFKMCFENSIILTCLGKKFVRHKKKWNEVFADTVNSSRKRLRKI